MSDCIAVVTTTGSLAEAQAIARSLIDRRLAACAQIEPIESYYTWKGALQHDHEYRVLLKTVAARYDEVAAAIRALHGYELPAIHAVALGPIDPAYAQWIAGAVGPALGEPAQG
jgi:periplasmic divalent cation tolerance protein